MPDEALLESTATTDKAVDTGSPAPDPKPDAKPKRQRNQAIDELRQLFSAKPDDTKDEKVDGPPEECVEGNRSESKEASPETDAAKATTPAEEKPAKKLRKVEQPQPRQVDEEKLAEAVARATAKAIGEQNKPEPKKEDDYADLPKSRRNDIPIYDKLGKKEEFIKFSRAEVRYINDWEKNNPGETFDPDADDHETFYSKHEPDVDDSDFRQAEIEIAADRIVEKRIQEKFGSTAKELDAIRLQQAVARAEPDMARAGQQMLGAIVSAIDKDLLKAIEEGGAEKVEERDLVAHDVIKAIAPRAAAVASEAVRIFASNGRAIDDNNPIHQEVINELFALELRLLKLPDDQLLWDNRQFLPRERFNKLTADRQREYWCVGVNELQTHLTSKYAKQAKDAYDYESERAKRYASRFSVTASESSASKNGDGNEDVDEPTEKPNSPSSTGRAAVTPGGKVDIKANKSFGDRLDEMMWGKRA